MIHNYDFPGIDFFENLILSINALYFVEWKFSLYFLAILPEGANAPLPGTAESEDYLWTMSGTTLELTHNWGSEADESFQVNNGNIEPFRGSPQNL